jgi:signal transduction histidine kinase
VRLLETLTADEAIVNADRRLLISAISNLVTNAIKFSCDGGQVDVRTRSTATSVTLEVEDQCGGLGPDAMSRISAPWVQVGANRSGFGLGVAIARRAVEAHGGRLDVRDLHGIGCIFTIELPRTLTVPGQCERTPLRGHDPGTSPRAGGNPSRSRRARR